MAGEGNLDMDTDRHRGKIAIFKPRRGARNRYFPQNKQAAGGTKPADILIPDFQPSEL